MFFEKDNMNIYVGNIPWSTSEEELEAHFAQYGNVNAVRIITEGHSGRSKGFGFVEMESKEAGQAAIEALDGNDFGGRDLRVNEAKPRELALSLEELIFSFLNTEIKFKAQILSRLLRDVFPVYSREKNFLVQFLDLHHLT